VDSGASEEDLSRRDGMMVAWHKVPGNAAHRDPSRRERYDGFVLERLPLLKSGAVLFSGAFSVPSRPRVY
jgi:hypothetical protein